MAGNSHPGLDRVVVVNDDCAENGGAAAIALSSARLLRKAGIPVTVLSGLPDASGELARSDIDTVTLGGRHIGRTPRSGAALRGLYDPVTRRALAAWLEANDTPGTVYHLHNWHKVLSPSIFAPLRSVAARLVLTAHDYFLVCPNGGYFLYPGHAECELRPGGARCMLTSCDRRHYAHKLWRAARHGLRQVLFDLASLDARVLVVHDGLVPHFVRAGIPAESIRVLRNPVRPWRSTRVPVERNRDVFFVGRLDEDKGVDLLAAAARLADVRLQLIGDGPLAPAIMRHNPEAELLGWRSRGQIAELIGGARLLVAPTRCRETFGLAPVEALMSGIPVVMSRFALIADEIVENGFGIACDPYDVHRLAATLRHFCADDPMVKAMSRRAFAAARQLAPNEEQWRDRLLAIYRERLGSPSPASQTAAPRLVTADFVDGRTLAGAEEE